MFIKQMLALIVLTLIVLFANSQINAGLHYLIDFHQWISDSLATIFSTGKVGDVIKGLFALLLVPCLIAGVTAIIYWAMKRATMPYIKEIIWLSWLIQAVAVSLTSHLFFS
jgi:hypothetical protein